MAEIKIKKIGALQRLLVIPEDRNEQEKLQVFCTASVVLSCRMCDDPGYEFKTLEIKTAAT